jgi:hypothetical protein
MKKLTTILMVLIFGSGLFAQNITNTLPSNGNFFIKDVTNTFFTLQQSTGNIGIGTNSFDPVNPEKLLIDCGTTTSVNAIYAKGSINSYFQFNIRNYSNGNQASSDVVMTADNGTETTNFMDIGINGSGYVYTEGNPILTGRANDCYILASGRDLYITNNSVNDDIIFLVGGTDTTKQRLRLFSNGNVAIGSAWNSSYKFQVKLDNSKEGHVNPTSGAWAYSSDVRLKKNIQPLTKSLEYIMNLNPVRYDWKTDEDSENGNQIGFIAQELEKYLPELVDTDVDGMKSVTYSTLTSVLTGAIKEQQVMIESQKNDIEQLKADIKELNSTKRVQFSEINPGGFNLHLGILLSLIFGALTGVIIKKIKS